MNPQNLIKLKPKKRMGCNRERMKLLLKRQFWTVRSTIEYYNNSYKSVLLKSGGLVYQIITAGWYATIISGLTTMLGLLSYTDYKRFPGMDLVDITKSFGKVIEHRDFPVLFVPVLCC